MVSNSGLTLRRGLDCGQVVRDPRAQHVNWSASPADDHFPTDPTPKEGSNGGDDTRGYRPGQGLNIKYVETAAVPIESSCYPQQQYKSCIVAVYYYINIPVQLSQYVCTAVQTPKLRNRTPASSCPSHQQLFTPLTSELPGSQARI
eukprot:3540644-Rhodomonas_salina.1